jgi:CrcB protein
VIQKILLLCLAGSLGTLCRYGLAGLAQRIAGTSFPVGTFVVNIVGCLVFGLVAGLFEDRIGLTGEARFIILTGFMGAFTTFSTYMFESVSLMQHGQWLLAGVNIGGQIVGGVACILVGMALGRIV